MGRQKMRFACFMLLSLCCTSLFAQERTVNGVVVDGKSGEHLPGAIISAKGRPSNVSSKADGTFTIRLLPTDSVLVVSYIGYKRVQTKLGNETFVTVSMDSTYSADLNDVVVVGYGTQKRSAINGAVSTVKGSDIEDIPAPNIAGALRGLVPGLSVSQSSGKPGASITLNVRNATVSETAQLLGVSNEPLYVIDGITVDKDAFDNIDPSMVDNITILKDASAAIYGASGSNGVILITTKQGQVGKGRLNYNGYYGLSDATRMPDMLSAYDLAVLLNDGARIYNTNSSNYFSDEDLNSLKTNHYTNWFDEMWQPAFMQRHNLSFSGGSDRVTYFAGGSYQNENGNYAGIKQNKYSFRSGVTAQIAKGFKATIDFNVDSRVKESNNPTSENDQTFIQTMMQVPEWVPAVIDGKYVNFNNLKTNPVASVNTGYYTKSKSNGYRINTSLSYDFAGALDGLSAKFQISAAGSNDGSTQYRPSYRLYTFQPAGANNALLSDQVQIDNNGNPVYYDVYGGTNSAYTPNLSRENSYQANFTLNYTKNINKHAITALLGGEQAHGSGESLGVTWLNQILTGIDEYWAFDQSLYTASRSQSENVKRSYFGRLNYSYDNRYYLDLVTRLDASSNFAKGNIWGVFPNIALGWTVSNEKFFKENVSIINYLKFRFSWGIVGNSSIDERLWQERYTADVSGYLYGGGVQGGMNPQRIPNPDLTWENKRTVNAGVDIGLFGDKLNISVDVFSNYVKNGFDKGTDQSFPMYAGFQAPVLNYMKRYNWGSEYNISYRTNLSKDLRMDASMNFSLFSGSIITQMMYDPFKLFENSYPDWQIDLGTRSGDYSNIGLQAIGMFRTQDEVDAFLKKYPNYTINNITPQPGWLYFVDENGDGKITERDQIPLYDRKGGLGFGANYQLGFSWKGLSLKANIAAKFGGVAYYDSKARDEATTTKNVPSFWKDHWSSSNPDGKFPRFDDPSILAGWQSSFWAVDGTTIRVNSMTLSYAIPSKLLSKTGLSSARFLLTGNNLWVIKSPFDYMDPYSSNIYDYPTVRTISLGLSLGL